MEILCYRFHNSNSLVTQISDGGMGISIRVTVLSQDSRTYNIEKGGRL